MDWVVEWGTYASLSASRSDNSLSTVSFVSWSMTFFSRRFPRAYARPPSCQYMVGGRMGWLRGKAHPPSCPNVRNTRSIRGSDRLEDGKEVLPNHVGVAIKGGFGALLAENFDEV